MYQTAIPLSEDRFSARPLRVDLVGRDWTTTDHAYLYTRERSAIWALEYVTRGAVSLEIDGVTCRPKRGDAYLIHKGSRFLVRQAADEPWAKYWLVAGGPLMESLISAYGLDTVYHVEDCPAEDLFRRAFQIAMSREDRRDSQDRLVVLVHQIILTLCETVQQRGSVLSRELLRAKSYVDNHLGEAIDVAALSRAAGLSPSQTIRLFKQHLRCTPHAYYLKRKLEEAQLLLRHSAMPVKEVAYHLGFCDEFYFSNVFKRKTGLSPSAYRERGEEGGERRAGRREPGGSAPTPPPSAARSTSRRS